MAVYQARKGGTCQVCGKSSEGGCYWYPAYIVLEVPGLPPVEPDLSGPVECDDCHTRRAEREYREMMDRGLWR